jgi:hypothetical protein
LKEIIMLQTIGKKLLAFLVFMGIRSPEYLWKWSGQPGEPRWELRFTHDGFSFHAVIAPTFGRPCNIGRFVSYAGIDTIKVAGEEYYLPARSIAILKTESRAAGLTDTQADRAMRRTLQKEMQLADDYECGRWLPYRMTVGIKRGRTELAMESMDGITMDPALLILGGEEHITKLALSLRASLCSVALLRLKSMASPVIHFN